MVQWSELTPVSVGLHGPPPHPPSGLMTPPAGWDPPSVQEIRRIFALFTEIDQFSIVILGECAECVSEAKISKPHQRTAVCGGGCV